jgi:hypothetical protein
MSRQRALVRLQLPFPDTRLIDPGEVVEWDGPDWKLEPLDPVEREVWETIARDDDRVIAARKKSGPGPWENIRPGDFPPDFKEQTSCAPL